MPTRTTDTTTTTRVQHIAKPTDGSARHRRENGPHLGDLREFVAACEGLPDDVLVRITDGHMDEGGRYDVTLLAIDSYPAPKATA
jgi:hypothetical protein